MWNVRGHPTLFPIIDCFNHILPVKGTHNSPRPDSPDLTSGSILVAASQDYEKGERGKKWYVFISFFDFFSFRRASVFELWKTFKSGFDDEIWFLGARKSLG